LRQVKFEAHTTPQPPQLLRSNAVLMHVLPHKVSPSAQVHVPFEQPTVPTGP
jgi:hypothetical protein